MLPTELDLHRVEVSPKTILPGDLGEAGERLELDVGVTLHERLRVVVVLRKRSFHDDLLLLS